MASNPLVIIPGFFFCIFQTNFAMATLGLKEIGKFLWEGREKCLLSWLSQFSFASWADLEKKNHEILAALQYKPLYNISRSENGVKKYKSRLIMARIRYLF